MHNEKYPYVDIRKKEPELNQIGIGYDMVQIKEDDVWTNVGRPVSSNYLLIPNADVRDIVQDICSKTTWHFDEPKTFFDGKRFMITSTTEEIATDVDVGDAVSLGIGAWNSYDGTKAFSLFMFINRLVCLNGMLSKQMFNTYKFRHLQSDNENWATEAKQAFDFVQTGPSKVKSWAESAKKLMVPLHRVDQLEDLTKDHLGKIPVTTYGKIMKRFLSVEEDHTGWGFLNAGTNVLWHSKTPTSSMYEQNAEFTDIMINAYA